MRVVPHYPNFEGELARRGIGDDEVAKALGISPRTLRNKKEGVRPFTWPEVDVIQKEFFPDLTKDYLFSSEPASFQGI